MTKSRAALRALQVAGLVLACMAPAFVLALLGFDQAAGTWVLPSIAGMMAAIMTPRRVLIPAAAVLAVAGAVAVPASTNAWLAALLMFAVAGATGMSARHGLSRTLAMVSICVAFALAEPPSFGHGIEGWQAALLTGALLGTGFGWSAAIAAYATRKLHLHAKGEVPLGRAVGYALVLGLEVGLGAWIVVHFDLGHAGAWLMLTTLVVLQPSLKESVSRGLHRALGTIAGVALAMVIGAVVPWTPVVVVLAMASAGLAVMLLAVWHAPYWRYVTALTVTIVLLEGMGSSIEGTALDRLWATLAGAAGALLTIAVIYPFLRRHDPNAASVVEP